MLTDSTARYVRPAYGGPACDHAGSVGIRVRRETAGGATEGRLVGPISFFSVSASGTLPAAVPGFHGGQADTRPFRLVFQERPQLSEGPTVQNPPLPPCSPYPIANPRQFLDGDPAPGTFCGGNDLLRNNMVDVFGKAALFAGGFLQPPLGRAGLSGLQFGAEPPLPVAHGLDLASAIERPVRIGGDLRHAKVHSEKTARYSHFRIGQRAVRQRVPLAAHRSEERRVGKECRS